MLMDSEIGNIAAIGPAGHPPYSKYERLIAAPSRCPPPTTVVVHPCDETSLRGADRGGGSRNHHSDTRRTGGEDHCRGARSTRSTSAA